jgi:phospholipid/cholesterol/gamma-HCH transport system substrate-binding protein
MAKPFESTVFGRLSRGAGIVVGLLVVAILATSVWVMRPDEELRHLTVDFPRTVSLYEGSDVRILGVPVGTVESVTPRGESVRVELSYEAKYDVPADAKAVIISPAIVGDRYVQLAPAYDGGPVMENDAHLDMARSEVPLELDEIYQSIDDLSVALGPEGANQNGALSRLLDASAANLDGNGEKLNQTLRDLSLLSGTLSNNKDELFAAVSQVEEFVHALKVNDDAVRETLEVAPLALTNLGLAGDPETGTLRDRDDLLRNITELTNNPQIAICSLISQDPDGGELCRSLRPVLKLLEQVPLDELLGRGAPLGAGAGDRKQVVTTPIDTDLADLLRADR